MYLRFYFLLKGVGDLRQDDGDHHEDTAEILAACHLLLQDDGAGDDAKDALEDEEDGVHRGMAFF